MGLFILWQLRQAENTHHVDVCIIYHQSDVANIAGDIYHVFSNLSPKHKINEYLEDLFHSVKVNDIPLPLDAVYYDYVQVLIVNDYLEKFLILREKSNAPTW